MSKFEHIHAFIQVVEANGFAAAAKKQGISTAAISRHVSRLEAKLGVALLRRTTRRLTLTELGEQYYQDVKKTFTELRDAELALSGDGEASGLLSVMSGRYYAMRCLLPRLGEFMAQNPHLRIKLELAERFPDLTTEKIDLIFGVSMDGPDDLVRRRVTDTRYVLCASPAYLENYGLPKTPDDLPHHRYISHSMRKPDNALTFKNNKTVYVKPILWLNDSNAMRDCAISGLGIVKLHDYVVSEAIKAGQLVEILSPFRDREEQPVYLYYQKLRYLPTKIRRFIDFYTD